MTAKAATSRMKTRMGIAKLLRKGKQRLCNGMLLIRMTQVIADNTTNENKILEMNFLDFRLKLNGFATTSNLTTERKDSQNGIKRS